MVPSASVAQITIGTVAPEYRIFRIVTDAEAAVTHASLRDLLEFRMAQCRRAIEEHVVEKGHSVDGFEFIEVQYRDHEASGTRVEVHARPKAREPATA